MSRTIRYETVTNPLPHYRDNAATDFKKAAAACNGDRHGIEWLFLQEIFYAGFKTQAEAKNFLEHGTIPDRLYQACRARYATDHLTAIGSEIHQGYLDRLPAFPSVAMAENDPLFALDQTWRPGTHALTQFPKQSPISRALKFACFDTAISIPISTPNFTGERTVFFLTALPTAEGIGWHPHYITQARELFLELAPQMPEARDLLVFAHNPPEHGRETFTQIIHLRHDETGVDVIDFDNQLSFCPPLLDAKLNASLDLYLASEAGPYYDVDVDYNSHGGPANPSYNAKLLMTVFAETQRDKDPICHAVIAPLILNNLIRRFRIDAYDRPLPALSYHN